MGMMLGGGMGRELATWIVEGSADLDLFAFDTARFHRTTTADSKWIKDRTHESYAKTYAVVLPHDEALAGRNARTSAVHRTLVRHGCVHQARHGFERPGWFVDVAEAAEDATNGAPAEHVSTGGWDAGEQAPKPYDYYGAYDDGGWRLGTDRPDVPGHSSHLYNTLVEGELTFGWAESFDLVARECKAAREGVAIFDQSYFGKFFLEGPDAARAASRICGANPTGKAPGAVTYTPLCNERGGVEADLTVTYLHSGAASPSDQSGRARLEPPAPDRFYIAAGGTTATRDFEWISRQIEREGFDATLTDASDTMTMLSVQGEPDPPSLTNQGPRRSLAQHYVTCPHTRVAPKTPSLLLVLCMFGRQV
jgi:sarcosine dehydrogenase